jgi:hypothetical protein
MTSNSKEGYQSDDSNMPECTRVWLMLLESPSFCPSTLVGSISQPKNSANGERSSKQLQQGGRRQNFLSTTLYMFIHRKVVTHLFRKIVAKFLWQKWSFQNNDFWGGVLKSRNMSYFL